MQRKDIPDASASVEQGLHGQRMHPIFTPQAPDEAKTQELIETAYTHGEIYEKPPLSDQVDISGGYVRDQKPSDFDNQCLRRTVETPVHTAILKCSVQGSFIDQNIFADTNILLEILQNAEPRDSKGTWFDIEFYADGKWRSVVSEMSSFTNDQIEAVRIVDNGRGYLPTDMTTVGGGKRADKESAGRFGTGMKISDRSALGKEVQVIRYSRNWRATPFLEPVLTSAGHDYTVSYRVDFLKECGTGSVVEYKNLTHEMFVALRKIQDIYFPLDRTAKERVLARNDYGLILKPKNRQSDIKVFGRSYDLTIPTDFPLLFSYDLHDCAIDDQNRHYADTSRVTENIRQIWQNTDDVELFKTLLQSSLGDQQYHEHAMTGITTVPNAFKEAAIEILEIEDLNRVYIEDGETTDNDKKILNRQGYKKIRIGKSRFIEETFANMGVYSGKVLIDKVSDWNPLSGNLDDYRDETFASCACRAITTGNKCLEEKEIAVIVIDSGSKEEMEIPYAQFIKAKKEQYTPVRLVIRVKGIQVKTDRWGNWTHQFDTFSMSCIAAGVDASLYNGHYELNPGKRWGSNPCVHTRHWETFPARNLEIQIHIETVAQATELAKLHHYSLNLNPDYQPVVHTPHGDIVVFHGGEIYEEGIKRNNFKETKNFFTYNIPTRVTDDNIAAHVSKIVQTAEDIEVPRAIFKKAKTEGRETEFLEYAAAIDAEPVKVLWRQAFVEIFGETTVIDDCEEEKQRMIILAAEESSGIKKIRLHKKLTATLHRCGVKKLSTAVKAKDVKIYSPNPLQEAIMMVARIADETIGKILPEGVKQISPPIRLAKSATNEYGQNLRTGQGYLDPFLEHPITIYVFDEVVTTRKISELVTFILNKKIEVYRAQMTEDQYLEFRTAVIARAEKALTTIDFLRKVRTMIFNKKKRITKLVDETIVAGLEQPPDEEDTHAFEVSDAEERTVRKIIMGILEDIRKNIAVRREEKRKRIEKERKEKEEKHKKMEEEKRKMEKKHKETKKEKSKKREKDHIQRPLFQHPKTVAGIIAATAACALIAVYGDKILPASLQQEIAKVLPAPGEGTKKNIADFFDNLSVSLGLNDDDEYQRPPIPNSSSIGVDIERGVAGGGNSPDEYLRHQRPRFISNPPLNWGRFMTEKSTARYSGRGWEYDPSAPDFGPYKFSEAQKTAHYQKVKGGKTVTLRIMAGGYIDQTSIKLIRKDGTESSNFTATQAIYGEYKVDIRDKDVVTLIYHTAIPINWQYVAEALTDEDFASLPADVYAYYTATPDLDLNTIRFRSSIYPQYTTLAEFIGYARTLKPFDRIKVIREVVGKMRYTRTEKTETAYSRFHRGKLPEKDFLQFVLNSTELDQPGDGDCDAQNSTYALMARFAGIPTKLDFVFTEKGIGHGPAVTFLPKIGWILTDTMGERIIQERIISGGNEFRNGRATKATQEQINKRLLEIMRARSEYEGGQCPSLWNSGHPQDFDF